MFFIFLFFLDCSALIVLRHLKWDGAGIDRRMEKADLVHGGIRP